MRSDREGQPHIHARRIAVHRSVEKSVDLGEGDDLVEFALDLDAAHAEDRAVEVNVFTTAELRVKPGSNLEQAGNAASQHHSTGGRLGDAAEDLEQRAFTGAVAADNAHHLAWLYLEGDILQ